MVKVVLDIPEEQVQAIERAERAEKRKVSHQKEESNTKPITEKVAEKVKEKTGFEPGDVIKAPIEAPSPDTDKNVTRGQVGILIIGFAMVVVSLIAWPLFGFQVALTVVLVGATFISVGTLVRI